MQTASSRIWTQVDESIPTTLTITPQPPPHMYICMYVAADRPAWRRLVYEGCRRFEARRLEHSILKRALRKQHMSGVLATVPTQQPDHLCDVCDRVCLSRAGLLCHMRSYGTRRPDEGHVFTEDLACHLCDRMCKSRAGLLSHIRAHKRAPL